MLSTTPLEQSLLNDISRRTGLEFRRIGGIDTRDRAVANKVLPILAQWVDAVEDPNHRHALYACFDTPHAAPYLDKLISWWEREQQELARGSLTQTIASLARPADGQRLWEVWRRLAPMPFQYKLLAKLATFPTVADQVKETLVEALQQSALRAGDLQDISRVEDPGIRRWFEENINSSDRWVRSIAKRVTRRKQRLPCRMERATFPRDRMAELFSTEVDAKDLKRLLRRLGHDLGLRIPTPVAAATFVSSLSADAWMMARVVSKRGEPASLWFRLEDVDTVEVAVTAGHPPENSLLQ